MHLRRSLTLVAAALALLFGCGGDSGNNGGGGTTVTGQVIDTGRGQGLSGRTVLIGGKSTTTDANGQFTLSGVATPYDVVVIEPAPDKLATIYTQLTRTDPKLLDIAGSTAGTSHSATVGGALTGGDAFPTPAGTRTAVSWGSPETSTGDYAMTAQYSFPVNWAGPTMTTGTLRGLQWTVDNNGTVNGYRSHGTRTGMSLADSATVTNADITLGPLQTDMVSVVITPPANHQTAERDVILTFADRTFFPLSADALGDTPFTVPVPTGIGASAIIQVTATNSDAGTYSIAQVSGLQPGTSNAPLSLPAPAVATSPADGATGVDTATDFVWTPLANGIHVLFLSGSANDPGYAIVSAGTRTRIPDLGAQGLGLPSGHPYDFGLLGVGPYASIDAFASGPVPFEGFGFQTGSTSTFTTR